VQELTKKIRSTIAAPFKTTSINYRNYSRRNRMFPNHFSAGLIIDGVQYLVIMSTDEHGLHLDEDTINYEAVKHMLELQIGAPMDIIISNIVPQKDESHD
jgi:hypothetical protein